MEQKMTGRELVRLLQSHGRSKITLGMVRVDAKKYVVQLIAIESEDQFDLLWEEELEIKDA